MHSLLKNIAETKFTRESLALIESGKSHSIKTLHGSLFSVYEAAVYKSSGKPVFIICPDKTSAKDRYHDLNGLLEFNNCSLLIEPHRSVKSYGSDDNHYSWLIDGLEAILETNDPIIISTTDIFNVSLPKPESIMQNRIVLEKGSSVDFEKFRTELALNGFEKNDYVSEQGQFAVRGGIIDVFPTGLDNPVRIEFWGDEVESIREFSPGSQRSIRDFDKISFVAKIFHAANTEGVSSIFEYIESDILFFIENPDEIFSDNSIEEDIFENINANYLNITINRLGTAEVNVKSQPQPNFNTSVKELTSALYQYAVSFKELSLFAEGKIHLERFRDIVENNIREFDPEQFNGNAGFADKKRVESLVSYHNNSPASGFFLPGEGIAWLTEHQVFGRIRFQDSKRKKGTGISLSELKKLSIGDLVVHDDKGIGKFEGLETVKIGGSNQDCVKITYAGGDILYVHLNYIHKIQKYSATEGSLPQLSKLGTSEWSRKKARTKKKLKDIARELIKLYAERRIQPGYVFPADTVWQKEFEASFIYEDTPDQSKSTAEVKQDMESETPMDRLVCGDVGFGKTEVAIRAAFKAVEAGKQVAVLVPTTILAEQHYMTFRDRLQRYPMLIECLSRFKSRKNQNEIIEKVKTASIDILIGTHRILSNDLEFKNLGLLIIDEEQRFGVAAKEKLRQMRVSVDTLTLTATPIPRTLNFSLMGARDLSVIETPPRNRLPVYTEIIHWNQEQIVKAIEKELDRNGQVFFVSDKVMDLEKIAMDLKMLLPNIRFGVAHGQMQTKELEKVMEKFISRKLDVLVTTKIVESGLDIPNANTMLINRANNFGLAELYQLRGRVGRTNKQAFCYLIIPETRGVGHKALQRLQAIEEFTDLGSGFQLALRDMEIRGAGNLLGPEQSGYIYDLGFELYQKILDETVRELKVQEFSELFKEKEDGKQQFDNEEIAIEMSEDALLPSDYVKTDTDRYYYYKRLYEVRDLAQLDFISDELKDKYGKLPVEAQNLIFAVKIRMAAIPTGFERLILKQNKLLIELPPDTNETFYNHAFPAVMEFVNDQPGTNVMQRNKKILIEVSLHSRDDVFEFLWKVKRNLELVEI